MIDEMNKRREIEAMPEGIHAVFETTEDGVGVSCSICASRREVVALIDALVNSMSEKDNVSKVSVYAELASASIIQDAIRKDK